jgi:hypothetical protein
MVLFLFMEAEHIIKAQDSLYMEMTRLLTQTTLALEMARM